ncbi:complement C4-like isoform X2 [Scyliorhinus canicula]|uniref:complement C4-like isoform X2 n=1 Tax=Scyliorhinus canicula TaxID=7830 RepID=UPI0018F57A66|nr:complement C4-like isoform X2 [Scyliorhinus canicula]
MEPLVFLLWFSALIPAAEQAPSYLISAPNIIHVGVKESVAIQLDGVDTTVDVRVYLFDLTTSTRFSDDVEFVLTEGNGYHQIKDIIALSDRIKKTNIWLRKEKHIYLAAECKQLFPGRKLVPILLSSKRGYIFIQTDKPIYTPGENVRYRIFTLDHYMKPVSDNIEITIYNSRNVQFPSLLMRSGKVFNRRLKIPDIAEPGIWRIEAQFSQSPMSMVSAQFEVKQFVLPSFKVEVSSNEMFYLITREEFRFKITADYTYGKPVEGMAYVRFGIIDDTDKNSYLRGLEQQLELKGGEAASSLTTVDLSDKIKPSKIDDHLGRHLYMAVTVFEISSGQMEEVELRNIKFVSSPYVIDLSKTSGYFIPKVPFTVLVGVTLPDGSPASGVPVKLEEGEPLNTEANGHVLLTMQSPANADSFEFKVTAGDGTLGREISKAKKTVLIYKSKSKSYLHVDAPHRVLDHGSSFSANIVAVTPAGSGDVKYYYYMILSKGKVLTMDRVLKTEFTQLTLPLSIAMVPAFRLVLYYYINVGGNTEMVANAAWIDVKDVCEGKITIKDMRKEYYRPAETTNVHIETEDVGSVYLAIVDTAVYILNNKNKLTPGKVFQEMNAYDLGCTFGGGADNVHVFADAGLSFISNVEKAVVRTGHSCKTDGGRMKRSLNIQAQFVGKLSQYTNSSLMKCCTDGITTIPMKRNCEDRAKRVKEEECRKVFLTCCEFGVELRHNQSATLDELGRTAGNEDEEYFDESSVRVRSNFPQSWQWSKYRVLSRGEHKFPLNIPDSITTWEIQAVGMFEEKGFCVAEPKKMKVFRPFFISLRLPYSVKRNEQLEVRAILYNYFPSPIKGEGVLKTEERSIAVNPRGKSSYQIIEQIPSNMVPDTDSYLYILARGEVMGQSVENCLTPEGIDSLIRQPTGCAEQTSMSMAPTVFAVKYLDKSEQWLALKAERKDEAIQFIEAGYNRILEYKKNDGSYGAWLNRPSSTWLTAFIVKILSMVRSQIDVKPEHIQQSALYLVGSQRSTGYFLDPHPVIHREMQGGIGGVESKISTTAFVTIALMHSLPSFETPFEKGQEVRESIARAVKYLSKELDNIKRPYVMAITAYAFAFVDPDSSETHMADSKLKQMEVYDKVNDVRHWKADSTILRSSEDQASAITVEATSYALLQAVIRKKLHYANTIVKWLTEQRNYGGGFRSTQDTVIALEALSEYSIATFQPADIDIQFVFSSPSRSGKEKLNLKGNNTLIQDELRFPLGESIDIELSGSGNGTLTFLKTYHLLEEPKGTCDYFILEVAVKGKVEYSNGPDYSAYEDYDLPLAADQPVGAIGWFDLRSRRRRDAPMEDNAETLYYEVCARHKSSGGNNQKPSGMAIVDISLLSGFEPDQADLDKLKNLADRYIDSYEFKDGRVLLYLETVTDHRECFVFGAKQIIPVGLIQPASATLYDYYNPRTKCTIFYNAPEQSTILSKLCQDDVCECAEGSCPRKKKAFTPDVTGGARMDFACYSPIVEYAYMARVIATNTIGSFTAYAISIIRPIKKSKDENILANDIRYLLKRKSCPMELQIGKSYLLMGHDGKTQDSSRNMQYILDSNSWIEDVPSEEGCKGSRFRKGCQEFNKFVEDLEIEGCQI